MRRTAFFLFGLVAWAICASGQANNGTQIQKQADEGPAHGTVNVILANGHTLVAATDSMLTVGARHTSRGVVKLYKIDSRTIATMASLYSQSGPAGDDTLAVSIPQMMLDYSSRRASIYQGRDFATRAQCVFADIRSQLDRHLRAMVASNPTLAIPDKNHMLELTVAGFDLDNSIKIAEITLIPSVTGREVEYVSMPRHSGKNTPPCAFTAGFAQLPDSFSQIPRQGGTGPVMFAVTDTMFCEVAGLRDIPEQMLESPANYPDDLALQAYVRARSERRNLSVDELRKLAVDLVDRTTADERRTGQMRVGGEVELAVLSDGRMIEEPKPVFPEKGGEALHGTSFHLGPVNCNSARSPFGQNGYLIQLDFGTSEIEGGTLKNCTQELDGVRFLNSTFVDSHLTYSGRTTLFFPETNVVTNTSLELGTGVDLHGAAVHALICNFKWTYIRQGSQEVKSDCNVEVGH
jgi:hypothetical protein